MISFRSKGCDDHRLSPTGGRCLVADKLPSDTGPTAFPAL